MSTAVERLSEALPQEINGVPVDAAMITSGKNLRYLTGFPSTSSVMLVTREQSYFLTDFRYAEAAEKQITSCQVVMYTKLDETIRQIISRHHIRGVLFENDKLSLGSAKKHEDILLSAGATAIEDTALDMLIRDLRMIKSPEELQKIKDSQKITDAAFQHVLPMIKVGAAERDIALEIEFFMRKQGADGVAFDLIVVSGKNGSMCHGVPSSKKIEDGDFVTMDTGALLDGYHSDMTRTVAVGHVSGEQRTVYDTVLKAQLAALAAVRPGIECGTVDAAARDIIEKDFKGTFGHSTGHGVGVDIHEWPRFSSGDKTITKPGMVVTVEPGIYIPGKFGVRIEDMVAVTETGCENLTHSPKALIIL